MSFKKKFFLGFFFILILINLAFYFTKYVIVENQYEKYILSLNQDYQNLVEEDFQIEKERIVSESKNIEKKIAIVIDDLGIKSIRYYLLEQIPYKINLAIIPGEIHSQEIVKNYTLKNNFELILHMPMEAIISEKDRESPNNKNKGYKFILTSNDKKDDIHDKLNDSLDSLLGKNVISGINNHMGSYVTSSENMVKEIIKWSKKKNLYVLDSFTTPSSIFFQQAKKERAKSAYNQVFIDSIDDPSHIKRQLNKVEEIAKNDGKVIAIGHIVHKYTIEVLFEWMHVMNQEGYSFVFVSELLQ
jgi:uncharacterized protein